MNGSVKKLSSVSYQWTDDSGKFTDMPIIFVRYIPVVRKFSRCRSSTKIMNTTGDDWWQYTRILRQVNHRHKWFRWNMESKRNFHLVFPMGERWSTAPRVRKPTQPLYLQRRMKTTFLNCMYSIKYNASLTANGKTGKRGFPPNALMSHICIPHGL